MDSTMRTTLIGIGTATVLLALLLVGVQHSRPQAHTAREAISVLLQQRAITFDGVRVENGRCLPTPEQCVEYRADVVVVAGQLHRGLMQCWEIDQKCELWVADLGLDAPLPQLAPAPAWVGEIERLAYDAAAWVRQMLSRS